MPIYEFQCSACGKVHEKFRAMEDSAMPSICSCGEIAPRILSRTSVRPDYPGYSCPVTGKWIEGRKAHEANLKLHGCHVLEKGEKEAAAAVRKQADEALENAVAETAAELVAAMPEEKQRQLGEELTRDVSISYQRG